MKWTCIFLLLILTAHLLGAGCLQEPAPPPGEAAMAGPGHEAMLMLLGDAATRMQEGLNDLDRATAAAVLPLETTGLSGPTADAELGRIVASHPAVWDVVTYDLDAVVLAAEPETAKALIGQVLDVQPTLEAITEQPLMSDLFPLERGGDGVVIVHPVLSADGTPTGAISTAFVPWELIAPIAGDVSRGTPYTFMVAQTEGRIVYDPDQEEIGRETTGESLYEDFPEIQEFALNYAENRSGYGTYSFYSTGFGEIVRKEAFWTTIGLHGTEWRVFVIGEI